MIRSLKALYNRSSIITSNYFSTDKTPQPPQNSHYKKLNIPPTSSISQIKKSYLNLLKQYHPDISKGHEQELEQIKKAYEILSNPELKKQYDNAHFNTNQTTKDKEQSGYENVGAGPYQTQEEYKEYSENGFYGKSRLQWRNIRHGLRKQSYIQYDSAVFHGKGPAGDENIMHFNLKNAFLEKKNQQLAKQNQPTPQQITKMKQRQQQYKMKHLQRVAKAREQQAKNSTLFKLMNKFRSLFTTKN